MNRQVVVLDHAVGDLEAGREFYEEREPGVGDYFIDCLTSDISSLRLFSGIHREYFGLFKMNSRRFPFAIYYGLSGDLVRVGAVLDMRQNPDAIRKTLRDRQSESDSDSNA